MDANGREPALPQDSPITGNEPALGGERRQEKYKILWGGVVRAHIVFSRNRGEQTCQELVRPIFDRRMVVVRRQPALSAGIAVLCIRAVAVMSSRLSRSILDGEVSDSDIYTVEMLCQVTDCLLKDQEEYSNLLAAENAYEWMGDCVITLYHDSGRYTVFGERR